MTNLLPGMITGNSEVEFFNHENEVKVIQEGTIKNFNQSPFAILLLLREEIENNPEVAAALLDFHPLSETNRLEQLVKCRFGGLDHQADIKNGKLQDGEYWNCPRMGSCKHEGVLCKLPKINNVRLSKMEVKLIQESTTDKKNEVIAGDLGLALGTFHQLKKNIHQKFGVQTKQELTCKAMFFNLI